MIQVLRTGELEGYIVFFYGEDWEKKAEEWAKKTGAVMGKYYKQIIGNGVIVCYYPKKKEEE